MELSQICGATMTKVLQASQLTLHEVEAKFHLQETRDPGFFPEWEVPPPDLSECERHGLDQAKADFLALAKHPLHEEMVKLVIMGPLLSLSGLYRSPFHTTAEHQVELAVAAGNGEVIRGRLDLLVLHQQLWVTVIESKRQGLNVTVGLPQALVYMLSSSNQGIPTFGFVTNGDYGLFIKLLQGWGDHPPIYSLSEDFSLHRRRNDLYRIVGVLRHLGAIVATPTTA
jgi:hypothetical protein